MRILKDDLPQGSNCTFNTSLKAVDAFSACGVKNVILAVTILPKDIYACDFWSFGGKILNSVINVGQLLIYPPKRKVF